MVTASTRPRSSSINRTRRSARWKRVVVWCIAAATAVVAAASDLHPTGFTIIDVVYVGAWAAAMVVAGSVARRWTWVVAAGCAGFVVRGPVATTIVWIALALAVVAILFDYRSRILGALVAAGAVIGLINTGTDRNSVLIIGIVATATLCLLVSGARNAPRKMRKRLKSGAGIACVVAATFLLVFLIGLVQARNAIERALADAHSGLEAARSDDPEQATGALQRSADRFSDAHDSLNAWWVKPAQLLPGVRQQVRAIEAMADQGAQVSTSSQVVAAAAGNRPLSFKAGAVDLSQLSKLGDPLAQLQTALEHSQAEIQHIPTTWLLPLVSDRRGQFEDKLTEAIDDTDLAREVVRVAPVMLGADHPKHYLVAFATPDEARGRTGFMGDYGEITVDNGKLTLDNFGRTEALERAGGDANIAARTITGPSDYLARYGRFTPTRIIRNVSMSPDFPSVAQVLEQLYPQITNTPADGVISLDVDALAAFLKFTGPIQVPSQGINIDTDSARDFFLRDQYTKFGDNEQRQDALDQVAHRTFDKLTRADLPVPSTLAKTLGPLTDGGHLVAHSADPAVEHLLQRLSAGGELHPLEGDFLSVVDNNAAGNKTDLMLSRQVTYKARYNASTGHVDASVDITLHNDAPAEGLPDYVIGNLIRTGPGNPKIPPGTNRTYLSIYSPLGLQGAAVDGQAAELESQQELGRNVYSTFLDIPSKGDRHIHLDLTGAIVGGPAYHLDLDHQPLVNPDTVAVSVEVTGPFHLHPGPGLTLTGDTVDGKTTLDHDQSYVVAVSSP